eukprot:209517_1
MTAETTAQQTAKTADVELTIDTEDTSTEDINVNNTDQNKATTNTDKSSEKHSTIKTSIFTNEGGVALAWLIYTAVYWTLLMWIPTLIYKSFETKGLLIWCIGCVGFMACSYTLYEDKYPSGSTKDNELETKSIGRYTCCLLTTAVITDVCVLIFYSVIVADKIIISDAIRLTFHCIHIFWTSLFFYNKFYQYHYHMATRA